MTFRAKPVVKRDQRPRGRTQDRRNFYLNLGFGLIVVLAVLILAIAAGLSWYNAHLAPVGSVDGKSISKDEFADRYQIETWRLDEAEARIRTAVAAGHLTEAQGTSLQQTHRPAAQSLAGDHPRAAHRHQVPGEACGPGRRHGRARGHRRPARHRGDDARVPPRAG